VSGLPELHSRAIGGRTLAWREVGAGDPVVLVHGIGGHSGSWGRQYAALADTYRVIGWDAPGYGGSESLPDDALQVGTYAAALSTLLTAVNVERAHFVGHSLGAVIVSAVAQSSPALVRSLTLLQPVTGGGRLAPNVREQTRLARIADMKRLGPIQFAVERGRQILSPHTAPALADEAVEVMKRVPERGYLEAWEMMCAADIYACLDGLSCPVQVICGADDPVCPPATAQAIAKAVPQADYLCLENVGHYASIEAADILNAKLRRFIEAHQ
jgi:pimeloyl-ACP methyl ester carboxylesterase